MARTLINGATGIQAGTLARAALNTSTAGSAVIAKAIAGSGISLTSTGADAGTGDVTLNATMLNGSGAPAAGLGVVGSMYVDNANNLLYGPKTASGWGGGQFMNGVNTSYTLPAATSSILGGVIVGSNITNASGTISLASGNVTSALGFTPANKAGDSFTGAVSVNAGSLSATASSSLMAFSTNETDTNGDALQHILYRTAAGGSDWSTAYWRIQRKVDSTQMGYVEFNSQSSKPLAFGLGSTEYASFDNTGLFKPAFGVTVSGGALTAAVGTATLAPLKLQSGTNLTTAAAGAFEYDGAAPYFSVAASTRGVLATEQLMVLSSAYTLTSQTAAQKVFNGSTNGAVTLPAGTYQFECMFSLSSMSATSGSFGFALGGTATKTESWRATAVKAAPATANSDQETYNTAANTTLVAANTTTTGYATIRGIIRVTVAGTVIPQVSLGVAAAAVVGANSYFKISPVGGAAVVNVGNWS